MRKLYVYNHNFFYPIIFLVLFIIAYGAKYCLSQKKQNAALRIKTIYLNKIKKTPKAWVYLTDEEKKISKILNSKKIGNEIKIISEIPLSDQTMSDLVKVLSENMKNFKNLNLANVNKNIDLADEIILRESDSYLAYKAKLILLILKESKFNQIIDDYELNMTLEKLANFEIKNNSAIRNKANITASDNIQQALLENSLEDISLLRDNVSLQSSALDKSTSEFEELQALDQELVNKEQLVAINLESLKNNTDNSEKNNEEIPNEDFVEIPFLRFMAKKDYDSVVDNAKYYLEKFPNSLNVYYYFLKALSLQGKNDEILLELDKSNLSIEDKQSLLTKLNYTNGNELEKYWEKLKF